MLCCKITTKSGLILAVAIFINFVYNNNKEIEMNE